MLNKIGVQIGPIFSKWISAKNKNCHVSPSTNTNTYFWYLIKKSEKEKVFFRTSSRKTCRNGPDATIWFISTKFWICWKTSLQWVLAISMPTSSDFKLSRLRQFRASMNLSDLFLAASYQKHTLKLHCFDSVGL